MNPADSHLSTKHQHTLNTGLMDYIQHPSSSSMQLFIIIFFLSALVSDQYLISANAQSSVIKICIWKEKTVLEGL